MYSVWRALSLLWWWLVHGIYQWLRLPDDPRPHTLYLKGNRTVLLTTNQKNIVDASVTWRRRVTSLNVELKFFFAKNQFDVLHTASLNSRSFSPAESFKGERDIPFRSVHLGVANGFRVTDKFLATILLGQYLMLSVKNDSYYVNGYFEIFWMTKCTWATTRWEKSDWTKWEWHPCVDWSRYKSENRWEWRLTKSTVYSLFRRSVAVDLVVSIARWACASIVSHIEKFVHMMEVRVETLVTDSILRNV